MKSKITELRAILPIPLMEAKQLLENNDSDIETCVYLYTAKAIKEISAATGCNSEKAEKHYKEEKFDINRAISMINYEIYDLNYKPIEGVTKLSLQFVKDWIYVMETDNFGYSLSYSYLQKAIDTMILIPKLTDTAKLLQKVKNIYDTIFEGYDDTKPLEDFVKRNRKLDDESDFQIANNQIPLQTLSIKEEISKHWRNVQS